MAKRGRKRKQAKRHSCGKIIQPAKGVDVNAVAARMQHRASAVVYSFPDGRIISRHIPIEQLSSEKAECPVGRYLLAGAITEAQYQAALRIRHNHALAKKALCAKRMRESIAGFGQPSASVLELSEAQAQDAIARYLEAMKYAGTKRVQNAIINCVFYEWELLPGSVLDLQKGLFRLVKYYGLGS